MFLIFINDLPNHVKSEIKIFAEDTKIFRACRTPEDINLSQDDINAVYDWSQIWQLPFNENKCTVIHYGKNNFCSNYEMNNHVLHNSTEEKDLGVLFDENLKFQKHISTIVSKTNRVLGVIKRTLSTLNCKNFNIIYKSLVRPILEYCSSIWYPQFKKDSDEIEKVQGEQRRSSLALTISHMMKD